MPARNVYLALAVIFVSLFIALKTSVKEQVLRGAALHIENASLNEVDANRLFEGALAGVADAVDDAPYTQYIPPVQKTDYMREIQGQFAGVGLGNFVKDAATGEFYFVPLRGAPAAQAGLQFGDRLVEVDGKSVKDFSLFDLTNALRGDEKTVVKLKIRLRTSIADFVDAASTVDAKSDQTAENAQNAESSPTAENAQNADVFREVELTRAVIQQDVVAGDRLDENGNWIYTLKDYPQIGYVAIEQFADATTPQTLSALESLEKAGVSSVILDFRGNPGGFLPAAIAISDEFVQAGAAIVEVRDRSGAVQEIYRATNRPKKSFRVVVLVDGDSASASEIVAAALQDSGVAAVGGERSYGKGTIQSLLELPCELGLMRLTSAEFRRPSGKPIRRLDGSDDWGVSPDAALAVAPTVPQRYFRDLLRAVRASAPERTLDPRALPFAVAQTNVLLRRAADASAPLDRLETLQTLGFDPQTAEEFLETKVETVFEPVGRAPYFDEQLDRAVDRLLGTLPLAAPETPGDVDEANPADETPADEAEPAAK